MIDLLRYEPGKAPDAAPRKDLGTPASHSSTAVHLSIDGVPITVPAGTSVMRAAREAGIDIAKLCATDSLNAFGSCRLCVVDIAGRKGLPASCTTLVEEGMVCLLYTSPSPRD